MDIHVLTKEEAMEINTWAYDEPYNLYSFSGEKEVIEELLDGTYYGCCDDQGEFIGYFVLEKMHKYQVEEMLIYMMEKM